MTKLLSIENVVDEIIDELSFEVLIKLGDALKISHEPVSTWLDDDWSYHEESLKEGICQTMVTQLTCD